MKKMMKMISMAMRKKKKIMRVEDKVESKKIAKKKLKVGMALELGESVRKQAERTITPLALSSCIRIILARTGIKSMNK